MNKEANVHRLPTEDESYIAKSAGGPLFYNRQPKPERGVFSAQHLYITTDEEIKEGDHILMNGNKVTTATKYIAECIKNNTMDSAKNCRKIIATTDPKLKDKCEQIPRKFIKRYCKAGGIDKVLVEVEEIVIDENVENSGIIMTQNIIKTDSNNCIIIHPVEEKMYSREEVVKLLIQYQFDRGISPIGGEEFDKWIKENL